MADEAKGEREVVLGADEQKRLEAMVDRMVAERFARAEKHIDEAVQAAGERNLKRLAKEEAGHLDALNQRVAAQDKSFTDGFSRLEAMVKGLKEAREAPAAPPAPAAPTPTPAPAAPTTSTPEPKDDEIVKYCKSCGIGWTRAEVESNPDLLRCTKCGKKLAVKK